jgi:hypothetical protein
MKRDDGLDILLVAINSTLGLIISVEKNAEQIEL